MATISHLPHVVANALVAEAAAELTRDSERMPEVGPSFRDTTRVAGSNPAIWADIFASNREAVADSVEAVARAPRRGRGADPRRRPRRDRRLARRRRRGPPPAARGRAPEAARCASCGSSSPTSRGRSPTLALALGEAGVNIEDMALYPAPDMTSGAVSLWVAGAEQAERAAALVRELGHTVSVLGAGGVASPPMTRFDPSGPLRGALRPPPTSRSPTGRR